MRWEDRSKNPGLDVNMMLKLSKIIAWKVQTINLESWEQNIFSTYSVKGDKNFGVRE